MQPLCRAGLQPAAAAADPAPAPSASRSPGAASRSSSFPATWRSEAAAADVAAMAGSDRCRSWCRRARDEFEKLAALLNGGERVTLFCGAGCAGAHDEVVELARRAEGADRACASRQGASRIRQSLRCRHDRAGRLRLRLCGDEGLRHAADAGHGFPLPAVLSRAARGSRRSTCAPRRWAIAVRSSWACSARSKDTLSALLPADRREDRRRRISTAALAHYRKARAGSRRAGRERPAQQPHPSAICDAARQRAGGGGCDLHLRCRHADRLDGALSEGERQAPAIVGSFNHGSMANAMLQAIGAQCAFPEPAGHFDVRATAASP